MDDVVLIGVDGGATKVLVHCVEILTNPLRFAPQKPMIEVGYESSEHFRPNFKPRVLATQLREHKAGKVKPGKDEEAQELAILESFVRAITNLEAPNDHTTYIIGIGLPGLKTPNRRGISAMANGPRMPQFLNHLTRLLKKAGYRNLAKIHALGSDADYCGLGEHWGDDGAMRAVENAYYIGLGTGVADALLLRGEVIAFDEIKTWMAKSWEMRLDEETTYEDRISAQGIQAHYAKATGSNLEELNQNKIFPWQIFERALDGDASAMEVASQTCDALADLLYQRITTLYSGAEDTLLVDSKRKLKREHPYLETVLNRIVIGQRIAEIWQFKDFHEVFRTPVETRLGRLIHESTLPAEVKAEYLTNTNRLRDDLIIASNLRHAPALGAAVDAYLHWIK